MDTKSYLVQKLAGIVPYTGGGNVVSPPRIGGNLEKMPQIGGASRYFRSGTPTQVGTNPPPAAQRPHFVSGGSPASQHAPGWAQPGVAAIQENMRRIMNHETLMTPAEEAAFRASHPTPVDPRIRQGNVDGQDLVKNVIDDRLGSRPGDARSALHQLFQNNWTIDDLRNMVLGLRNG